MRQPRPHTPRAAAAIALRLVCALALAVGFVPALAIEAGVHDALVASAYAAGDDDERAVGDDSGGTGGEQGDGAGEEPSGPSEADVKAAEEVEILIDALPSATSAAATDKQALDEAKEAYDKLTDAQKALVKEKARDKLEAVGAAVAKAVEALEQREDDDADGKGGKGDDGKGDADDADGKGGASGKGDAKPAAASKVYVDELLLKWDHPDKKGKNPFVGDGSVVEKRNRSISVEDFGQTVQLLGYYLTTDTSDDDAYQTADSSTTIGAFDLNWRSSDESIATVDAGGLVTPRNKNGTVTITAVVADAKVYQGSEAPKASVQISFDGQEGKYVKRVDILDDAGKEIGEQWGGVTVYDKANEFHQLHVRLTWYDVETKTETTVTSGSGDSYSASGLGTTVTWSTSTSNTFTINKDTGRLKAGNYSGNAYVTCTAVGGKGGKAVADTANVQVDTGVYEYMPADSLTLKVVWEERPDEVVKEKTYSFKELKKLLSAQKVNATVVNASRYGVISAEGFLFKDVVNLVAVDDADVLQYRFTTADGYDNPVSYKYLFESGNRYFFPNYDVGKSRAEGKVVPPVLAYKANMEWDKATPTHDADLDEGTRFRLVFGCLASGDANTSFQIYYIRDITIVLKGAPSAGGSGGSQDADSEKDADADSTKKGASGKAAAGKRDSGTSKGDDGSSAKRDKSGDGSDDGAAKDASAKKKRTGDGDAADAQEDKTEQAQDAQAAGADIDAGKRWRVYQMMNKTNSDVPDWSQDNPISPFAAPLAAGTLVAGAGVTGIGFRRRLK